MEKTTRLRTSLPSRRKHVTTCLLIGFFVLGVYLLYRWAEPSPASIAAILSPAAHNTVNLELEDASFDNFVQGYKNWSLHAGRIILDRPVASGIINSLQSAEIEDIRDGKFFATPTDDNRASSTGPTLHPPVEAPATVNQATIDSIAGEPVATFSAQHGRYGVSNTEGIPPDMLLNYTVLWQFQLTGDVKIRTREGYRLNAPAITMVELFNRRTGKKERQMLCPQGVLVEGKGVRIQANMARYSDATQSVECQNGVRGALRSDTGKQNRKRNGNQANEPPQENTIQADTMQWMLKENIISCPQSASGILDACPYTAEDIQIDVQKHYYTGRNLTMQIRETSKMAAGSLGLLMATATIAPGQQPPSNAQRNNAKATAPAKSNEQRNERRNERREAFSAKRFSYDDATQSMKAQNFRYLLDINVNGEKRDITGDNGTYDRKNGILDADGHLVMDEPEHHVTGLKGHVDEKKELATLTGDVVMTLKPQKGPDVPVANPGNNGPADDSAESVSGTRRQGGVVTCDKVDSYYKRKISYLSGNLTFKQHILRSGQEPVDRIVTAEHAEYDSKKEKLILYPPVKGSDTDGLDFVSDSDPVTLRTHPGAEGIENVRGTASRPVKEQDEEGGNPNPKSAPPKNGKK